MWVTSGGAIAPRKPRGQPWRMSREPSLQTLEALRDASALLAAGQHARVRESLAALLRIEPDCADAHRMLALSLYQTGEFVRAQKGTAGFDCAAQRVDERTPNRRADARGRSCVGSSMDWWSGRATSLQLPSTSCLSRLNDN